METLVGKAVNLGNGGPARPDEARLANPDLIEVVFPGAPEKTADKIKRLQREAARLASYECEALVMEMQKVADRAQEISEGGDAYLVGVREQARVAADNLRAMALTIQALLERDGRTF